MMTKSISLITEVEEIKIGAIEKYLEGLPEKILSLGMRVLLALVFFVIGVNLIKLIRRLIKKALQRGHAESGITQFLDSLVKTVLYIILFFMIASGFGVDATSVAALLGTAGVAIGLAVQGSLSNLAGGVLLMLLQPFKTGDYIKEDTHDNEGTVIGIDIFYTKLRTVDNQIIVLPNGTLANSSLTNSTACAERRLDIMLGLSYQTDIKMVRTVIEKVLNGDQTVLKDKERVVYVDELAEGRVKLGVRCWFALGDYWEGKWRITEQIKEVLDEAGVVISPQRVAVEMVGKE